MTRNEFMAALCTRLAGLPEQDVQKSLAYYSEMIDDCMEDGMSEEEAVASMGDVREIAEQILADIPLGRLVKERIRPKRKLQAWEIVLLILGSPVWLSLLIAAAAVILSLFVSLVAVLISVVACLWALGASFCRHFNWRCACGGTDVLAGLCTTGYLLYRCNASFGVLCGAYVFCFFVYHHRVCKACKNDGRVRHTPVEEGRKKRCVKV